MGQIFLLRHGQANLFGDDQDLGALQAHADKIGYPVMIKAAAGGGGRGMRLVPHADEFAPALKSAKSEARSAFGDDTVLLERAIVNPRHIETQVFGDRHGNAIHLGERGCSVQRRHQKLIEEAPSPAVPAEPRAKWAQPLCVPCRRSAMKAPARWNSCCPRMAVSILWR